MILISVLIVLSFVGQKPEQLVPSAPDPVVVTAVSSAPVTILSLLTMILSVVTPLSV